MKTAIRTPHFLRVTQALALVSGLGIPLAGCGGEAFRDGPDGIEDGAVDGGEVPDALLLGIGPPPHPDSSACTGICDLPDAFSGSRVAPDAEVPCCAVPVPEGIGLPPNPDAGACRICGATDSGPVCNGICVAPDASWIDDGGAAPDVLLGIGAAPDAGPCGNGVCGVLIAPDGGPPK